VETDHLVRARNGDPAAFGHLVELYAKRVYGLLLRLVHNREDAEDLTQETFLRAFRSVDRFDVSRPFRSWLYTITINAGLNALRSRRIRGTHIPLDAENQAAAQESDGRRGAIRTELRERLDRAVSQLPVRSALLIQLHYTEGLAIREAAGIVGMSEGAAKVALCRARGRLRELLAEEEGL